MTWKKAKQIEYNIALIQARQELYGVYFDLEKAYDLVAELDDEIACIEHKVLQEVPKVLKIDEAKDEDGDYKWCSRIFKKDGDHTKYVLDNWPYPDDVWGIYSRISWHNMNLNSHDQVKTYLLSQGWQPTQWNYDDEGNHTSPKLTEDSFASVKGDVPKLVARRNVLMHRRNTVLNVRSPLTKGWIPNVRDDGRIEARAIPQATNTGRYRHQLVVNVPKASPNVVYGYRMRELFTVPKGKVMLGCDAAGLEARMEAHYCYKYPGGQAYAHELIDGDVHANNAIFFGTDRDGAKAPKYGLTYGAQPPKLATILGCSLDEARQKFDAFWDGNTALAGFKEAATQYWQMHGYILGIDRRQIKIRSSHSIVNAAFQSGGSIVVKVATLFLNKWIREEGIDAHQVLHMHDEFQWEVYPEDVERVTELALLAFEKAGEFLKVKVPIIGEVKVGNNWAETH